MLIYLLWINIEYKKEDESMEPTIRNEEERDYGQVENLIREAFWNVYRPGCNEHLVMHNLRKSPAFVKELDFVIEDEDRVVGQIAYSLGKLVAEDGQQHNMLTFGPVCIHPENQGQGLGERLINYSIEQAKNLGYKAIFITGNNHYYSKYGFEPASQYGIHLEGIPKENKAPFFMVKVLEPDSLDNLKGLFYFDEHFDTDPKELEEFEKKFPEKVKEVREGQLE